MAPSHCNHPGEMIPTLKLNTYHLIGIQGSKKMCYLPIVSLLFTELLECGHRKLVVLFKFLPVVQLPLVERPALKHLSTES